MWAGGRPIHSGRDGMNDIRIGHEGSSFDMRGFWQEANSILFEGTREMLINVRDKASLVAAYDRMDWSLAEMVDRWQPPEELKAELHSKLNDRLSFIGRKMKSDNIDPTTYWAKEEKKVSIAILAAAGVPSEQMRLDRLTQTAAAVLSGGSNLSRERAEGLVREFASYECRSLRDILDNVRDEPNHMEFLRFLVRNGTKRASAQAQRTIDRMVPAEIVVPRKLTKLTLVADNTRQLPAPIKKLPS